MSELFLDGQLWVRDEFRHISRKVGRKSKKAWTDFFSNEFSTDSLFYIGLNKKSLWSVKTFPDGHIFIHISSLF